MVFAIIGIALCVATAFWGWQVGANGMDYKTESSLKIEVDSLEDLNALGESIYNDEIYLLCDITVSDTAFRIGSEGKPFEGIFDGRGHTVYLAYGRAGSEASFFGHLAENAVVKNVNFVYGNVELTDNTFGGVAKINEGLIENCSISYQSLTIGGAGIYSPLVTINRGKIAHVTVSGTLGGELELSEENGVFFGNVCVYNSGEIEGAIVEAGYEGLAITDKLSVLKGECRNNGISAVRYKDVEGGSTSKAMAIIEKHRFVSDATSVVEFSDKASVYNTENIFSTLDFSNVYWKLDGETLKLILQK